jgi:hypothetical protein
MAAAITRDRDLRIKHAACFVEFSGDFLADAIVREKITEIPTESGA